MIPFTKPDATSESYHIMGEKAARAAFADAGLPYGRGRLQQVYVAATSTATPPPVRPRSTGWGFRAVPIVNVNNNCATGSSALFLARFRRWNAARSGFTRWRLASRRCALALSYGAFADRPHPMERFTEEMKHPPGVRSAGGLRAQAQAMFGGAGAEYAKKHDTRRETFAKIASKARSHAHGTIPMPCSSSSSASRKCFGSPQIYGPLTRFQCCPPTCGAAGGDRLHPGLRQGDTAWRADVAIKAQAMTTDGPSTFDHHSMMKLIGYDMAKAAAQKVYRAGRRRGLKISGLSSCMIASQPTNF